MRYRPLVSKPGFFRWTDVTRVRYARSLKWFRTETADGAVVRVSIMLTGLPEFARAMLDEVSAARIDADTRFSPETNRRRSAAIDLDVTRDS